MYKVFNFNSSKVIFHILIICKLIRVVYMQNNKVKAKGFTHFSAHCVELSHADSFAMFSKTHVAPKSINYYCWQPYFRVLGHNVNVFEAYLRRECKYVRPFRLFLSFFSFVSFTESGYFNSTIWLMFFFYLIMVLHVWRQSYQCIFTSSYSGFRTQANVNLYGPREPRVNWRDNFIKQTCRLGIEAKVSTLIRLNEHIGTGCHSDCYIGIIILAVSCHL